MSKFKLPGGSVCFSCLRSSLACFLWAYCYAGYFWAVVLSMMWGIRAPRAIGPVCDGGSIPAEVAFISLD